MAASPQNKKKINIADVVIFLIFVSVIGVIISFAVNNSNKIKELNYADFCNIFYENYGTENQKLKSEIIIDQIDYKGIGGEANKELYEIVGTYKSNQASKKFKATLTKDDFKVIQEAYDELISLMNNNAASPAQKFTLNNPAIVSNFNFLSLLSLILPVVLIIVFIVIMLKTNNNSNNQAFDFSKSRARLTKKSGVTFKDVAGLKEEKEELEEIVDFLMNPTKYFDMGARIPKGILLCGSPGTGKTLLARAVAGEAKVPFYSISGSDFVEMFVGVGASRVRDMFKTAKQNAPCIIFIDEIDAVGRQRGTGLGGGHDEREQTLNQLLVEMDGFAGNSGIIVMAATNRPDILDPALLRPGRFDRKITLSNPDVTAREEILKVHARNKRLSPRVNLHDVAKRTPGFAGADLENLLNEAALLAARENCKEIKIYHIDEAVDRVMMGPAKKSRKYGEREKALIAYHEAGHAVIGLKLEHAQIVQKVTIIPRGSAGGYNLMTPEEETFVETREYLIAEIVSFLAGRVAEELVFNKMSTGAHNDFQNATNIARAMVTEYGMSSLGPVQYEQSSGQVFLGRDYMTEKKFSDQVALEIDQEVRKIINECYEKAKSILTENRSLLDLIALHLVEVETLTREDIEDLMKTGQLTWYEKKKAKLAEEEKLRQEKIQSEENEQNNNQGEQN